jgi:hypothetical protein
MKTKWNITTLTKVEALEACVRIWSELAKTGESCKYLVEEALNYKFLCPCCHYVKIKLNILIHKNNVDSMHANECALCPLLSLWTKKKEYIPHSWARIPCGFDSAYYGIWCCATPKKRMKYASLIADGSREALCMEYLREMNQF